MFCKVAGDVREENAKLKSVSLNSKLCLLVLQQRHVKSIYNAVISHQFVS